ncbi:MAG: KEOPS complex subunit Pcc1 [Thermoproteota archaeon]
MIRGAHATIHIRYPCKKEAEVTYKAIQPETRVVLRYRTKVNVLRNDEYLILTFEAKDTTALRASINSYLSWIIALKNIYKLLEGDNLG